MFALFSPSLTVTKSRPFMEGFPRSAAGKVLKREMREPYWKASARKV
jgi:acyl-CoA synthetase (AMP-forming)/AMP-acid ligase II